MAIAVEAAPIAIKPDRTRQRISKDKGRFISKMIRTRNERGTNKRWQPSRSCTKISPPRATVLSLAIQDDLGKADLLVHEDDSSIEDLVVEDSKPSQIVIAPDYDDGRAYERERADEEAEGIDHHSLLKERVRLIKQRVDEVSGREREVELRLLLIDLELEIAAA